MHQKARQAGVKAARLYEVYRRWCSVNGHHALSNTKFGLQLKARRSRPSARTAPGISASRFDIGAVAESSANPSETRPTTRPMTAARSARQGGVS
jgi:phage/plasmid-associated DNA primase